MSSQYDIELENAVKSAKPNMARIAHLSGLATAKGKENAKALQAPGSKHVKGGRRHRRGTKKAGRRHHRKTSRR